MNIWNTRKLDNVSCRALQCLFCLKDCEGYAYVQQRVNTRWCMYCCNYRRCHNNRKQTSRLVASVQQTLSETYKGWWLTYIHEILLTAVSLSSDFFSWLYKFNYVHLVQAACVTMSQHMVMFGWVNTLNLEWMAYIGNRSVSMTHWPLTNSLTDDQVNEISRIKNSFNKFWWIFTVIHSSVQGVVQACAVINLKFVPPSNYISSSIPVGICTYHPVTT